MRQRRRALRLELVDDAERVIQLALDALVLRRGQQRRTLLVLVDTRRRARESRQSLQNRRRVRGRFVCNLSRHLCACVRVCQRIENLTFRINRKKEHGANIK